MGIDWNSPLYNPPIIHAVCANLVTLVKNNIYYIHTAERFDMVKNNLVAKKWCGQAKQQLKGLI